MRVGGIWNVTNCHPEEKSSAFQSYAYDQNYSVPSLSGQEHSRTNIPKQVRCAILYKSYGATMERLVSL